MSEVNPTDDELALKPSALAPGLYQGKTILISGGGSGIGRAMAWLGARLGARVLICGRKAEKVEAVARALNARGLSCEASALDIRDREGVDRLLDSIFTRFGTLDLLVNNAGGHFPSPAIDISERGWKAVIENNLTGNFHMMQSAARLWRAAGKDGSIVNITLSARAANHLGHSVASRAALDAFGKVAALEWAEYGIRVNSVSPGAIGTEIWRDEELKLHAQGNPQRRLGTVWEVAEATLFLGSPAAGFINGHALVIDGGAALWGENWPAGKPAYLAEATRAWDQGADLMKRWRRGSTPE